jgi:hypothetical protein
MEHPGLHSLHDKSVGSLNLPIRLWVCYGWWLMLNAKIRTTFGKLCSFELCSLICQNTFGHAESVYDALQELDYCLLGYVYCWHNFYPISERVNSDEQISETTWSPG